MNGIELGSIMIKIQKISLFVAMEFKIIDGKRFHIDESRHSKLIWIPSEKYLYSKKNQRNGKVEFICYQYVSADSKKKVEKFPIAFYMIFIVKYFLQRVLKVVRVVRLVLFYTVMGPSIEIRLIILRMVIMKHNMKTYVQPLISK